MGDHKEFEAPPLTMRDLEAVRKEIEHLKELLFERFNNIDNANEAAKKEMDRRLEGMNEMRLQLNNQANTFLNKDRYDLLHQELVKRVDALEVSIGNINGRILATGGIGIIILGALEVLLKLVQF